MGLQLFKKRILPMALTAAMVFSATPVLAASSDLDGHWAKNVITEWQEKGLMKGYADGTFKPDNSITRAEFVVLMNNAQGFHKSAEIDFTDVAEGNWYYDAVAKAVAAGFTKGYEDGSFQPNQTITRAEAAVMIANAMGLTAEESGAADFTDAAAIPAWAKGSIGAAVAAGYLSGYPDGSFGANASITRAEAVSALNRTLGNTDAEQPAEETEDKIVTEAGTTLKDETVPGDLIIEKSVGDGNVYLKNVKVAGDMIVKGGGANSVYLEDSTVGGTVRLEKENVHLHISGDSAVSQIDMNQPARLSFDESFTGTVETVNIPEDAENGSYTIESENTDNTPVENLNVDAKTNVKLGANTTNVNIGEKAEGTSMNIGEKNTVGSMQVDSKMNVDGKGEVKEMDVSTSGVTTGKDLTTGNITTSNGASAPTTPATKPSGGSSGSSSSKKITVNTLATRIHGCNIGAAFNQKIPVKGTTVKIDAITDNNERITLNESYDDFYPAFSLLENPSDGYDVEEWNVLGIYAPWVFTEGNPRNINTYEITVTAPGYSFDTITVHTNETIPTNLVETTTTEKGSEFDHIWDFSVNGVTGVDASKVKASISPANKGLSINTIEQSNQYDDTTEVRVNIKGTPDQADSYVVTVTIPADAITSASGHSAKEITIFLAIDVEDTEDGSATSKQEVSLDETSKTFDLKQYVAASKLDLVSFTVKNATEIDGNKINAPTISPANNDLALKVDVSGSRIEVSATGTPTSAGNNYTATLTIPQNAITAESYDYIEGSGWHPQPASQTRVLARRTPPPTKALPLR